MKFNVVFNKIKPGQIYKTNAQLYCYNNFHESEDSDLETILEENDIFLVLKFCPVNNNSKNYLNNEWQILTRYGILYLVVEGFLETEQIK